ncbi:bifunctional O-antigen ligase/aminoglycoside phosphotransferase family protein [Pseudomonas fluorescens]|uniref:bifunctional O-antigen ligase/aminoglycoside phosphotransferase family protein n=1 Tax=Pseudomonas fluorescens TaxID=294 RepID=UPI001BEC9370|nr:bifunctional O-antigen ligase/aminoglycoside phosphotransferase family protein [Pseudomonas fluorescens]MBT2370621.1 O-antigen ligase family protein [Pseudomonas fluorescens]
MHLSGLKNTPYRIFDFICLWILPAGFFMLLCGLFFLPDRGSLHKFYYGLFSIPALIALLLRPREFKELLREPIFIALFLFVAWALTSLMWSPQTDDFLGEFKPSLHGLFLFVGCYLLIRYREDLLGPLLFGAAIIALVFTIKDLYVFARGYTPELRMVGGGAFDNPLLSSHLFGFFCVYWLSRSMTCRRMHLLWLTVPAGAIMFAAMLATGSRTPLVALTLAALWISMNCWNRRSMALVCTVVIAGLSVFTLFSQMLIERGSSYRFEIWQMALEKIASSPWIGQGFNAPLSIAPPGLGYILDEPHNFALGVLYYVGIIGFLPWLFMQLKGLLTCWQHRVQPLFILASTWLVYGIGAGLTEGGGILSRPKEHWFLFAIPMALIVALSINARAKRLLTLPVKPLSRSSAEEMMTDARVIEADGLGPKVLQLKDGSFLKLFRRRSFYTSGSYNPYSQRFAANCQRLRELGITTPQVLALYDLHDGSNAVQYHPLSGQTLRHVLASASPTERHEQVQKFGEFMARLHEQGIYFRSLHLGNVLVLESGGFGLIDLADMRIYPSPLSLSLRRRNLRHMQRYDEDRAWLFDEHLPALLEGYGTKASERAVESLLKQIQST